MYELPEILEVGPVAELTLGGGLTSHPDGCDCTLDRLPDQPEFPSS